MSAPLIVKRSARSISLTALIDVVFILLMFFMLTSSFSHQSFFEFKTSSASGGDSSEEAQVLVLLANGELSLQVAGGDEQFHAGLSDAALLSRFDTERPLLILPVGEADIQAIVTAIERLNRLGASHVNLGKVLTERREK